MFLKETKETTTYERKSKYGKLSSYTRTKTITHWECDNCRTHFTKIRNGKYDTSSKSFCKSCISKIGLNKLAGSVGYESKIKNKFNNRIGQVVIGKDFYPEVYIGKDYPYRKGGYRSIKEHIFIIETHLKRKLAKNEVVHHIDGNKKNNHLSNLFLTTKEEHNKLHGESESIIFELVRQGLVVFNKEVARYEISPLLRKMFK